MGSERKNVVSHTVLATPRLGLGAAQASASDRVLLTRPCRARRVEWAEKVEGEELWETELF